jgi:hypothetical protein
VEHKIALLEQWRKKTKVYCIKKLPAGKSKVEYSHQHVTVGTFSITGISCPLFHKWPASDCPVIKDHRKARGGKVRYI